MLAELFEDAARGCLPGSPLTSTLLAGAAGDLKAGGVTSAVMAGAERDRRGTVPGLRFAGALHRLVLEGKSPELARHYPSVGGRPVLDRLWADAESAIRRNVAELRHVVGASTVQTNEPGRSAPLWGGLQVATQRAAESAGRTEPFPVRLLEIGASGGLNLRPHRTGYRLPDGRILGEADSPLVLDTRWTGLPPADLTAPLRIDSRAGCDLSPVDVSTVEGRLRLESFVWADWTERWQRLQDAFALAAADPVTVEQADGADWLAARLADRVPGVLTVVWHSVIWQYVPMTVRARGREVLARAAAAATPDSPLALLVFEPRETAQAERPFSFDLLLRLWPAGISLHLGSGAGHGIPFHWQERDWR